MTRNSVKLAIAALIVGGLLAGDLLASLSY